MRNLQVVLTLCVALTLYACGSKEPEKAPTVATPDALQDKSESKISLSSEYRTDNDLVGSLYMEQVEKSPVLKSLEMDLKDLANKPNAAQQSFNNYDQKSVEYYGDANGYIKDIKDSLLRTKMLAAVAASQKRYSKITTDYDAIFERMKQNEILIQDHHTVLKVLSTLPMIEMYQTTSKPDKKEFNKIIEDQRKALQRMDSVSPKY
jgi:abortive infection bacteriophage resistance protein